MRVASVINKDLARDGKKTKHEEFLTSGAYEHGKVLATE
jgi:hypothetical protein